MKSIIALGCLLLSTVAFAYEVGPIGVISSSTSSSYNLVSGGTTLNVAPSSATSFGGGIASVFSILPLIDLEIRAFYINQNIKANFTGSVSGLPIAGTITSNAPYIFVPVLVNVNIIPIIGVHGGVYYGFANGSSNSTTTTVISGISTTSTSNSSNTANDYGATLGLEFKTTLLPIMNLYFSADYYLGLANINSGTSGASSSTSSSIQGMAGVLFKM
jgi:hypothetical protein